MNNKEIGKKYNRLKIIRFVDSYVSPKGKKARKVECVCDCGCKKKVVLSELKRGNVKSCGCLLLEHLDNKVNKHKMSHTKFYIAWFSMKQRCSHKKNIHYKNYGGRGITVCERWLENFVNFKDDMYESYLEHIKEYGKKQTTLDRIDVNGNYCKENCRWATYKVQAKNSRHRKLYLYNGEYLLATEVAKKMGLHLNSFLYRVNNWNEKKAMNTKKLRYNGIVR